jgi:hypothetical protein
MGFMVAAGGTDELVELPLSLPMRRVERAANARRIRLVSGSLRGMLKARRAAGGVKGCNGHGPHSKAISEQK